MNKYRILKLCSVYFTNSDGIGSAEIALLGKTGPICLCDCI